VTFFGIYKTIGPISIVIVDADSKLNLVDNLGRRDDQLLENVSYFINIEKQWQIGNVNARRKPKYPFIYLK